MKRILLLLEHKENRRLLSELLAARYQVCSPNLELSSQLLLEHSFDLCILEARALNLYRDLVQARRRAEQPVFLPFLLLTARQDVGMVTQHLWQSIDDLIIVPIEKVELQARVEILLRSRQLSLQLQATNRQLQTEIAERQLAETERASAIAAQHQSELQFRRLVESNIISAIVADLGGNITEANDAFLQLVGYTRQELLAGVVRWDRMTPAEYVPLDKQAIAQLQTTGVFTAYEKEFIRKDGNRVSILLCGAVVEESPDTCIAFILDLSDRQRAKAEMRQALQKERELNELKSCFISMASHEFRNPLNGILAAAQILERYSEEWTKQRKQEFFQRIKNSISRMTELLDDVLVISKADTNKLELKPSWLNLEKFITELVEETKLSTGNRHKIDLMIQGQCQQACLDAKLLQRILNNLLTNAIKYSPVGSTITFILSCQLETVRFQIQDRGIGIPPEDLGRLFESFHRAANVQTVPGTGLGLAIVKRCVDLHQGEIAVVSQVGKGTTFTVTLPSLNLEAS